MQTPKFIPYTLTALLFLALIPSLHAHPTPASNPQRSISGKILYGPSNKPVIGIPVCAVLTYPPYSMRGAITNESGVFTFTGIPAGKYIVQARTGYGKFADWVAPCVLARPGAVKSVAGIKISLIHGGVITGKVTESLDGSPIQWATVMASRPGKPLQGYEAASDTTASDGAYKLRVIPGIISIIPIIDGLSEYGPPRKIVRIVEGQTIIVNLVDGPPAHVYGVVLAPRGRHISGAKITVLDGNHIDHLITTNAHGRFTINAADLYADDNITASSGSLATAHPVVYSGQSQLTLRLVRGMLCKITGTITGRQGKPLADATVFLTAPRPRGGDDINIDGTKSDSKGRFSFPHVPGNVSYDVRAQAAGYADNEIGSIIPTADEIADVLTISLQSARSFAAGTVTDSEGKPIAAASISDDQIKGNNTITDQKGHFKLAKVLDSGTLISVRTPSGAYLTTMLNSNTRNNIITIPAPLYGTVLGPDTKPVAGAEVLALLSKYGYESTTTDNSGRFKMDSPGASSGDKVSARCGRLGTAASITYNGKDSITLKLLPGKLCTIEGLVKNSLGKPIPNAIVYLSIVSGDGSLGIDRIQADTQGKYVFSPIYGNSQYEVYATAQGYTTDGPNDFILNNGETGHIPITLKAAPR